MSAYRFGPFVIDRASYRLRRGSDAIELSPKALDLLFLFAERAGQLVTKDDMLTALWPGLAVTDNALTQVVSDVRQALGDDSAKPAYVETVPRRGYRFVARVEPVAGDELSAAPAPAGTPHGLRTIAIADFANLSKDEGVAWLSAGIAETIANALRGFTSVVVLDRETLARAKPNGLKPDVVISGSYQRAGDNLRLTAQALDPASQQAIAQAKADGVIGNVFHVQDDIVQQLTAGLGLTDATNRRSHPQRRETSSLEAYRALTEGRLKLETLNLADVPGAIADFERAIRIDPDYAFAYVGLAHARFWRFQASRARPRPDRDELVAAIANARRAVELDPELAEGQAALALFLASAERRKEAVAAGRIAVALEPHNWRHQFRLGIASWGTERLEKLSRVIAHYPSLAYANVGIAMVYVARSEFDRAETILRRALSAEASSTDRGRFPGRGLNWLLGMIRLAAGDVDSASAEFERELAAPAGVMHGDEYAIDALNGLGFVRLAGADPDMAAIQFKRALERNGEHPIALIGLAQTVVKRGHRDRAAPILAQASHAIDEMTNAGRPGDAMLARAYWLMAHGRANDALEGLKKTLLSLPTGPAGWSIPIEPWLKHERDSSTYAEVVGVLETRAR